MKNQIARLGLLVSMVFFLIGPQSWAEDQAPPENGEIKDVDAWIEAVKEVYEKTLESSGKLTTEVKSWLSSDLKKIGTWEYKIAEFPLGKVDEMEKALNELGADRWECFHVSSGQETIRFFLKKPGFSYIKSVPSEDVLRLFPRGE